MAITSKTDSEIIEIALPMINDVVKASNSKDWDLFSKYQTEDERSDPENRRSVEDIWEGYEFFSTLNIEREILAVLRKDEIAQIVWKQTSTKISGDGLARYYIKEIDQKIMEVGFTID